uniref:Putative secreted protein n=1 Tax=Rhipicephalus microplus TaxID=6941 RepID=A0A6G5A4A0_RHIMP
MVCGRTFAWTLHLVCLISESRLFTRMSSRLVTGERRRHQYCLFSISSKLSIKMYLSLPRKDAYSDVSMRPIRELFPF